jgi:beta-mannosidase
MRSFRTAFVLFLLITTCSSVFSQDMKKIELGGNWKFRRAGTTQWMDAKVPGCVHTDLMKNKVIPDPFFRDNEKDMQGISDIGWEYKKTFMISDTLFRSPQIELCCEGLDTYANVYLNDSLVLVADNMFREWTVNIHSFLRIGPNTLRIQFPAVTGEDKSRYDRLRHKLPGDEKVVCRKAAYQFGWDFGPRLITSGIWKPIYIRAWTHFDFVNVQYIQNSINDSVANMTAVFTYKIAVSDSATIQLSVDGNLLVQKKVPPTGTVTIGRVDFKIPNPKRWWPNGMGDPYLYPIHHKIYFASRLSAEGTTKVGLRTIDLYEERDAKGSDFKFVVNGISIFIKGANYIPQDNFVTRVTDSSYKALVASVKASHMNMLRVWGGGIYEKDIFYNLCDENGILVWQDFMFACAMYPDNPEFIRSIQVEAIQNVARLRNHPCIALWCGNNEIDEGWKNWGWQKQYKYTPKDSTEVWNNYAGIFGGTLVSVIAKFDSLRPYITSTPRIGWGHPESTQQGDMHYWGVWWGKEPFSKYKEKTGRFMTEYGFQGFPSLSTIQKFTLPADRQLGSAVMKSHQKHPVGYETIDEYMQRDYKYPKDFSSYIYVSQLLQAEGIKTAIEAHRRAKPYCMGTLYWQLNDCWPGISWSSRDYYGTEKALHYYVKDEYQTLLVSPVIDKGVLHVYIVSDSLEDCQIGLRISLKDFSGKSYFDTTRTFYVVKNSSSPYVEIAVDKMVQNKDINKLVFVTQLVSSYGKVISRNNLYFVPVKDLHLEKPVITKTITKWGKNYLLTVATNVLTKNVFLTSGLKGTFSENFFDLLPGETRYVMFYPAENPINFESSLKITTLVDTY